MISTDEYMTSPVITAPKEATILDIAKVMDQHNIGSMVIAENNKPVGILTERDIVRKVVSKGKDLEETKAADIMTSDLHLVEKEATLMEVAATMKEHNMRRLIVMSGEDLVGIITSRDLIDLLV